MNTDRTVWRYGDANGEKVRVIRNAGGFYNALLRVDNVRWRVLSGAWGVRRLAFQAVCMAYRRHFEEFLTANSYDLERAGQ